jgi:hypothetical protein
MLRPLESITASARSRKLPALELDGLGKRDVSGERVGSPGFAEATEEVVVARLEEEDLHLDALSDLIQDLGQIGEPRPAPDVADDSSALEG